MGYNEEPDKEKHRRDTLQPFFPTREVDTGSESDAHIIEYVTYGENVAPKVNYAYVKLNKVSGTLLYDAVAECYIFHPDGSPMDKEGFKRRGSSLLGVKRGRIRRDDRAGLEDRIRKYFSNGIIRKVEFRGRPTTISRRSAP